MWQASSLEASVAIATSAARHACQHTMRGTLPSPGASADTSLSLPTLLQVTPAVIVSTGLIVGGCILLVAFGNHSSQEYDVGQLLELYTK